MENKKKYTEPIFIIGCHRSGTTLLAQLLAPTKWGVPVETHFIIKYQKRLPFYGNLKIFDNFRCLVKDILAERAVMQWKLSFDIDEFFNELPVKDYRLIVDKLCMKRLAEKKKQSWGDKTPHYILNLDVICNIFPRSKFLYIIRDGRDAALSLLQQPWGPNNIFSCAEYWQNCNKETITLEKLRAEKKLLDIRYEALLDHPEDIVRQIYNFLEEPYPNDETDRLIKTIKPGNYKKWKHGLSLAQRQRFEAAAGPTLERLGYEVEFPGARVRSYERMLWKISDRFLYFAHLVKINTIDTIKIRFFGKEPFAE